MGELLAKSPLNDAEVRDVKDLELEDDSLPLWYRGTYDEQRGLWNPFQPADRDAIYQSVRRQLHSAAADMGIVQRANASAAKMLETMFSVDGYTAEVRFGPAAQPLDGPRRDTAGR